jgi:signal transduction histidine kinase
MNVLVVDDHPTNRKLLRVQLEGEGLSVFEAGDGTDALAVLDREKIDAIVSDILMPRMDGYRFCFEVRKDERFRALPFIFYTSTYTASGDAALAFRSGADKFLTKPASAKAVIEALGEITSAPARHAARTPEPLPELDLMKEYSQRLVAKLEERNQELQTAHDELLQKNRELAARAAELERAKEELRKANAELEARVRRRTAQLETANKDLEAFSYSVSHDLLAPLRGIEGYSRALGRACGAALTPEAGEYIERIVRSTAHMNALIDALLGLSRVSRCALARARVDLSAVAREVAAELRRREPERDVEVAIEDGLAAEGDPLLLHDALANLLGNAWKFTGKTTGARIEFGAAANGAQPKYFVRDNGAGFNMADARKLFGAFQRLHSPADFPGSGIGLATVERIIRRHGGAIGAESAPGRGATFYFTLGHDSLSSSHSHSFRKSPAEQEEA